MQRMKWLSACIAVALSSQTWATDTLSSDSTDETRKSSRITCPSDISKLSPAQLKKLPAECRQETKDSAIPWLAAGATTATTLFALIGLNSGSEAHNDSGDITPKPSSPVVFNNNVTWDRDAGTLKIRDAIFTYSQNADGSYTLMSADGRSTLVDSWQIDRANNTIQIDGVNITGGLEWRYDDNGRLYINKTVPLEVDGTDGIHIAVNGTTISDQGGNTALNGATVMTITGNDIVINNNGNTVATGEGSVVGALTGDNITVNNNGSIIVDGGTAAIVNGDRATLNNNGDSVITNGGTGAHITGDFATVDNVGDATVDGKNSISVLIDGNNARVKQEGDLYVSGGARGIEINGDRARIDNKGNIFVTDAGSIGVNVNGDDAQFSSEGEISVSLNGTGVALSGDREQVSLSGDVNVTQSRDGSGNFQGATGVSLSGNDSTLLLNGSVNLISSMGDSPTKSPTPLIGVSITGENNTVDLNGNINIAADSDYTSYDGNPLYGIVVSGTNNTVTLDGGINITGDSGGNVINGVLVSGDNSMNISGHSVMDSRQVSGAFSLVSVAGGGHAVFDENSVTDIYSQSRNAGVYYDNAIIYATGSGSEIETKGTINTHDAQSLMMASSGALVRNSGAINVLPTNDYYPRTYVMYAMGEGSQVINASGGTMTLISTAVPAYAGGQSNTPIKWYDRTDYALLASDHGAANNEMGATLNLYGAGTYGVSASKGTATNAGTIQVDGFVPTVDADGNIIDKSYWRTNSVFLMGGGMLVGSTDAGNGDASGLNTGTINVNNEGFGMLAMNGGTAVNQGTINLTADEGVTKQQNNQLFAMGAIGNGVAINDKTGVINIDTDVGQAFYSDGSGTIVNYGTICTTEVCKDASEYNPTDNTVADIFSDGSILSEVGHTRSLTSGSIIDGRVTNAGTVKSGSIQIIDSAELLNESTGVINSSIKIYSGGLLTNDGTLNTVDMVGGTFINNGTLNSTVTIEKNSDAVINNSGSLSTLQLKGGTVNNNGIATARVNAQGNAVFNNMAGGEARKGAILYNHAVINNAGIWKLGYQDEGNNAGTLDIDDQSTFNNSGQIILDNSKNAIRFQGDNADATLYNTGEMMLEAAIGNGAIHYDSGASQFINNGRVDAKVTVAVSTADASKDNAFLWNQKDGVINFNNDGASAVKFTHSNYVAQNDGTMNISGNNAVAMEGSSNAQLVNNGTINLGAAGTTDTGMVAMQLDAGATADAVVENNGTINIYANDSYAFSVLGAQGHVVNNGTVYIADGVTGSGLIRQGDSVNVEGTHGNNGNSTEVHYDDYSLPGVPGSTTSSSTSGGMNNLNGYVVGTNADGSAGKLLVNNASMNGVGVNTGFTAGTSATSVTFDDVVQGSNLTDANAITSTSVVWTAQGSNDARGNVDVTMTKNAYASVATDSSVSGVAQALDAGYTNNELYTSLNVGTTAELNRALKQISGSQATTVFREARILSNRFSMLADAAPQMGNGLAFNVVAKGDPRAELGNKTQYDMLALRQSLDLTQSQSLAMEYGIARLDGSGSQSAGDNGVTGGYSQFFGLKHRMMFDNGMSWNNALRYDVHNLDSSRSVAYNDVNKTADTSAKQQYMEFRSEGAKTFELNETLNVTPYAGVKLRHTLEGGYQEHNAGDFNLNMNSGSETAVDSIVGLRLDYAAKNGWSANATLEGGPNLSYAKSQRSASISGAGNQRFNVDDGQKGGGVNSLATVGVKFSSPDSNLHLDAYQWREDGISDKGVMLSVKKTF